MGKLKDSEVITKNTVELLYKMNKASYEKLKKDSVGYDYLFNLGETLGEKEINKDELLIKASATKNLLQTIAENTATYFKKIKASIDGYKKIELVFQIITALGGSALLITLLESFKNSPKIHQWMQIGGALIATVGSLLSIFLNRGLGAWSFNRRNRVEDYDNLVQSKIRAEKLLRDLNPKIEIFDKLADFDEIINIITQTDELAEKTVKIISDYE